MSIKYYFLKKNLTVKKAHLNILPQVIGYAKNFDGNKTKIKI